MDFLFEINYWHWWILACGLLLVELLLPGVFFMWIGIAGAIVGLVLLLFPSLNVAWQMLLFAILSLVSVMSWRIYQSKYPPQTDEPLLNQRGRQYIGRVLTVTEAVVNGYGRVKVGDTLWKVTGPDCLAGSQVKVLSVDENLCLRVEPMSSDEPIS